MFIKGTKKLQYGLIGYGGGYVEFMDYNDTHYEVSSPFTQQFVTS